MLRVLNPEFAQAEMRGDRWAMRHADTVRGIDGKASRIHPERAMKEDGRPRNWCGSCVHPEGCVTCDLSDKHSFRKSEGRHRTS